MIPLRKLGDKADEIRVGDTIELDERMGIVRFIGSGRVQVDFNHRYAGRTLIYDVDVTKKLDDDNEKVSSLIRRRLPIDEQKIEFNIEGIALTNRFTRRDISCRRVTNYKESHCKRYIQIRIQNREC